MKKVFYILMIFSILNTEDIDPSLIIGRMLTSLGSKENVERICSSNYILRKVVERKSSLEPRQRLEIIEYFKFPNKVRVEMEVHFVERTGRSRRYFVLFDGENKWTNLGENPEKIEKTKNGSVEPTLNRWEWLLNFIKEQKEPITLELERKKEGTFYKLKFKKGKNWTTIFVDVNSYLPSKVIFYRDNFEIGGITYNITKSVTYEDFRRVENVLIPFKSESTSRFLGAGAHQAIVIEEKEEILELKIGEGVNFDDDFFNLEKLSTPREKK